MANIIGMTGERPDWMYIAGGTGNAALSSFTLRLARESVRVGSVNPEPIMSDRFKQGVHRRARRHRQGAVAHRCRQSRSQPAAEPC